MKRLNVVFGRIVLALLLAFAPEAAFAAYTGTPPLIVANGGTGATTLAAHGPLVGEGTGAIVAITPGATAGVPLISGGSSADPSYGTAVVAGGGTGLTSGTSGGIPYFSSTSAMTSSALLTANALMIGGGAGASPTVVASLGTTTTLLHGNASGAPTFGSVALADHATQGANTVIANVTGSIATPTAATVNACGDATHALSYVSGTGFGCQAISAGGTIPTLTTYTSTSPIAITATNLLTTVVSMATPAASTINLPTAVQTAGFRLCVKDGTTNFATNNATVKSPTSGTIDGVAGATGVVMNQAHQELCFISDATNWFIG